MILFSCRLNHLNKFCPKDRPNKLRQKWKGLKEDRLGKESLQRETSISMIFLWKVKKHQWKKNLKKLWIS